jgi:hypothetical protein
MRYFDIIAKVIAFAFAGLSFLLFLFVIIRDKYFPVKNEDNSNQSRDSRECLEDIW